MIDECKAHARLAIGISFVATSAIGIGLVFLYWAEHGYAAAVGRSILFLLIMGCVHLAGYLLYVQQFAPAAAKEVHEREHIRTAFEFAPQYWLALKFGLSLQAVFGVLTALMLDGGRFFGFFQVASIAYWAGILFVMGRRPLAPTTVDIQFIRWGAVLMITIAASLAPLVWRLIGDSHLTGWERLFGE
jgi:hypothetical protein